MGLKPKRKWRIVRFVLFAAFFLLFVAWRVLIAVSERTGPVAAVPLPTCRSSVPEEEFSEAIREAREQVQGMMAERRIPGLSVAVGVGGNMVWSEGFGYADVANKVPSCSKTKFRIASVSKPITAAAVARLYEQGRLDLDAPVQWYVPSFPNKGYKITPRDLAAHRSGIRHYRNDREAENKPHYASVTASLERFQNDPLLFPPNSGFHYSSYGYVLLSAVVEGASGEDFLDYVQRHIFVPLRMDHTQEDGTDPDRTTLYAFLPDGTSSKTTGDDLSSVWGAGGFLSTSEDLVRFGSAHLRDGFLRPETRKLLFTPRSRQMGIIGYGLGWMIARDLHLRRVYFHFGAGQGSTTFLAVYPGKKVCVAILANLGHAKFPFARLMRIVNPLLAAAR